MRKRALLSAALALAFMAALAGRAQASPFPAIPIQSAVPSNAYITFGGLDWAWASPVAADGSFGDGGIDLSFQGPLGWRLPSTHELAFGPSALDFVFQDANVPFSSNLDPVSGASFHANSLLDGDAACAAPYFNADYRHCDWGNGVGSGGDPDFIIPEEAWWDELNPDKVNFAETLVVRDPRVPEPTTMALLGAGLSAMIARRRARKRA